MMCVIVHFFRLFSFLFEVRDVFILKFSLCLLWNFILIFSFLTQFWWILWFFKGFICWTILNCWIVKEWWILWYLNKTLFLKLTCCKSWNKVVTLLELFQWIYLWAFHFLIDFSKHLDCVSSDKLWSFLNPYRNCHKDEKQKNAKNACINKGLVLKAGHIFEDFG